MRTKTTFLTWPAIVITILLLSARTISAQVDFTYSGHCFGSATNFNPIVANPATIATWNWDFGDGMSSSLQYAVHYYYTYGTYNVTLTVVNTLGVTSTKTKAVTINPHPTANFTTSSPACTNSIINFTDLSSTSIGYITTWIWHFNDGTPPVTIHFPSNPNVTHQFPNNSTFNVSLTIITSDTCTDSLSKILTVNPIPIANFTFSGHCANSPVNFMDLSSTNGSTTITAWAWDFGDAASGINNTSTLQNPTHIFTSTGTYTIEEIVTNANGCKDTLIKVASIYPATPVDFTFTSNCQNTPVQFTPVVSNMNAIATWFWDFGDGGISTVPAPSHLYGMAGNYSCTLSIQDTMGCTNIISHAVSIGIAPTANFSYQSTCENLATLFHDLSFAGSTNIVSWLWDFGDPASGSNNTSTLQNPVHTYSAAGTYDVRLITTSMYGCEDTIFKVVTVYERPLARFTYTAPQLNVPVQFTDLSVAGSTPILAWNWNFGDGNTSLLQNPSHTFTLPGSYTVVLTVTSTNGCNTTADSLLVVPGGSGGITINGKVMAGNVAISEANVHLVQVDSTGFPLSIISTQPGANNDFVFPNLPEGHYYLHATPWATSSFASMFVPTFYVNAVYWESATLIELGAAQNPYNILLAGYDIAAAGTFTVNGQLVTGGKTTTVAGQEVLLLDSQGQVVQWTLTDSNGNFSFGSLPAGSYSVYPELTGVTTYPFYLVLNESTSPAFVRMVISGQIITGPATPPVASKAVKIYPNPANQSITVESGEAINKIVIGNSLGNIIFVTNNPGKIFKADVGSFPSGIYFVKVIHETKETIIKVVVRH